MFNANFSSSVASTPLQSSKIRFQHNTATPQASTTPIAPPPSQPFASSRYDSGVSKLKFTSNANNFTPNPGFNVSSTTQGYDDDEYTEDMEEDGSEDQNFAQYSYKPRSNYNTLPPPPQAKSLMQFSTNEPLQTLRNSSRRSTSRRQQYSLLPSKGQEASAPGLARDFKRRNPPAKLDNDPDHVIVQTEELLHTVYEDIQTVDALTLDSILAETSKELENIWEGSDSDRRRRKDEELSIGPGPGATPFENARFVAILILRLHNASKLSQDEGGAMSMPQILLDWLNEYHMTIEGAYNHVTNMQSNVTESEWFWDVVELLVVRGRFGEAMQLLEKADFSYAKIDDGVNVVEADFSGQQLQAIQTAVFHLRQMLNASPARDLDNWHINGPEWMAYRSDVEVALEDLRESALAHNDSILSDEDMDIHAASGKDLPYSVFQRILNVYNILLGSTEDIRTVSEDWLEAAILLTVWWSGGLETTVRQWSFEVSRAHNPEQPGSVGTQAYLARLKEAFLYVTDPASKDSLQLNPQSALELALALTLQGDLCSAIALIQTYSLCISSALAEVGSWSGWLRSTSLPDGLGKEDLMVLTNGASDGLITKDDTLELYSRKLFERSELENVNDTVVDGWEIAISVISRCDSKSLSSRIVQSYIEELTVTNSDRASRLVTLCGELGMADEARRVSEQFGDYLVNTSSEYGTALLCYAKSQAEEKVRKLVDLLSSYCLVQSRAYPAESETDQALLRLVSNPKQALADIAETEPHAVEILQYYLVGYACLRKFYTVRDATTESNITSRKKNAAKALVAVINSAADSIYGGLYDPSRQSAIQVDGLLTLLGEATALTASSNEGQRVFTSAQLYSILAAVEDLQTVSDRVYDATEECLTASLRQAHGNQPPSPHAMLKKSISSGTNSNFSFSMMGSAMLAQSSESIGVKSMGSAVLVGEDRMDEVEDSPRAWDWRTNFGDPNTKGFDVLQHLRRNIAEELSMANLEEGFS